ncbi:MAG: tape measure protein [Rhizonema sp. NSF051]|nr:tape measure protein [Rhizonema sp. NSF051]
MASGQEIAKFWASLGVNVDSSSLRKVDKFLNQIDNRFKKMQGSQNSFKINLTGFKVDNKALTKVLGDALDSASNKVTFQINKFAVNERNLQASLLRAMRGVRNVGLPLNIGSGANHRTRREVSRSITAPQFHSERYFNPRFAERAGFGFADSFVGRLGPAGIAAGAIGAGGYAINRRLDEVQDRVIDNDTKRILLGQSVGGSDKRRANAIEWYKRLSQKYGNSAEEGITDFNTALVLQRGQGIGTRDALSNYDLFSQRFAVRHLQPWQQRNAMRQITQILGAGKVDTSDLNALIEGGGDPEIKSYLIKAWSARTGFTGDNPQAAFKGAMRKGEVSSNDLIEAYRLSSQRSAKELDEAVNSVRANAQRLANDKFWAQFERDGEEIQAATKDRIAAERELQAALGPLKDAMNQAETATMTYAAAAIRWGIKFAGDAVGTKEQPGTLRKEGNILSNTFGSGGLLEMVGNNENLSPSERLGFIWKSLKQESSGRSLDDWKKEINDTVSKKKSFELNVNPLNQSVNGDVPITDDMRNPKNQSIQQTTTVTIGDIIVQSSASNVGDLMQDFRNQVKPSMDNMLSEAMLNYAKSGR